MSHLKLVRPETPDTPASFTVWGLTGGIASGKSTVARFFEAEGIPVIDADKIARDLSKEGGAAHPSIVQRFGTADRARLRELIFSDPKAKQDLEAILHPLIQFESLRQMKDLAEGRRTDQQGPLPILYEAALLVETGRYKTLKGLIVVEAPEEVRAQRLVERDQISPDLARSIIAAQTTDARRRAAATHLIRNYGDLDELRAQVKHLAEALRK